MPNAWPGEGPPRHLWAAERPDTSPPTHVDGVIGVMGLGLVKRLYPHGDTRKARQRHQKAAQAPRTRAWGV